MFFKISSVVVIIGIFAFLIFGHQHGSEPGPTYIASVVEFSPEGKNEDITLDIVKQNLEKYTTLAQDAKSRGADIIVFPEYGLTTIAPYDKRDLALELSQIVPAPEEPLSPCESKYDELDFMVTKKLSCIAKNNQIYLVVNLIQKVLNASETLLYNTNVVFNRDGKVIARYRKFHLFGEIALNETEVSDETFFRTDFGVTFGVITCFDLMFHSPSVDLVRQYKVNALVFPTAWFSELPFLTASQAQAAWATGMQVDLLASGINDPDVGSTGSGIYQKGEFYTTMLSTYENKLMVSTVRGAGKSSVIETTCGFKTLQEDMSKYKAKTLLPTNELHSETICDSDLCCEVKYQLDLGSSNSASVHYKILVFNGERTHAGIYRSRMQVCAVVACSGSEKQSCAHNFSASTFSKEVKFTHLNIAANFSNDQVLPNTLNSHNCGPFVPESFEFSSTVNNHYSINYIEHKSGLHTFGLYSHGF